MRSIAHSQDLPELLESTKRLGGTGEKEPHAACFGHLGAWQAAFDWRLGSDFYKG